MKLIEFDQFGGPEVLQLRQGPEPQLRPNDLLIRTHAAGVNRADLTLRRGAYGRPNFGDSETMGLEIAGDVIALGPEVQGFSRGDRVMGIVGGGGYAELSRIDHRMAMHIPTGLDSIQAAAIPECFVTAHEALVHLARIQPGESVLIHAAASGVGTAAIQLAHASHAKVYATADASKLPALRDLGADVLIPYKTEDYAQRVARETNRSGVNVILDFIGAPNFERNIDSLSEGGRLIQVGLMAGLEGANLPLARLVHSNLQVIGTIMKSRSQFDKQAMVQRFAAAWMPCLADGTIKPIIDSTFPLAEAATAHRRMEQHLNSGKIVLTVQQGGNYV